MPDPGHPGFGLYLHWPFCAAKCPYCDFNSHVSAEIDIARWQAAYLAEIDRYAAETRGSVLGTVYFGGGTPSLMPPGLVGTILDRIGASWPMVNDPEITLEANPSSVEAGRFSGYRTAGVSRLSLGVQALDDASLRQLGRLHDVADAIQAIDIAQQYFERSSFDLIYARQDQTLEAWRRELTRALALTDGHISLYQLTIEDGTAFGDRLRRGKLAGLPGEDLAAEMFFLTQELCEAAGLPAYEISNHAEPGEESRHNLIYWRGGDYVGIGPGAHGRLTLHGKRRATWTPLAPALWLEAVERERDGEAGREVLGPDDAAGEYLMMSLRTREGMDIARYESLALTPLDINEINHLAGLGLVRLEAGRLIATASGRAVLNPVITALLPD